jgi:hypothetical protein
LTVAVRVAPSGQPPPPEVEIETDDWPAMLQAERADAERARQAAEQQQQQQQ